MGRRSAENVRALSFARTMHHEATESDSVTVHGRRRERKESSAPGEDPEEVLSDAGSIPAGSTIFYLKKARIVAIYYHLGFQFPIFEL